MYKHTRNQFVYIQNQDILQNLKNDFARLFCYVYVLSNFARVKIIYQSILIVIRTV